MYVHNKNKSYITPRHKPTPISRVLSECDLYISSCDNDPDMKSVKENFDRQTSQRFEEYEKRMIKNRKRCKEQCDKDIQEIIVKDKVEKSLSEKVEKGCLKCGCGLGGVAAGVGIIGPVAVKGLENAALLAAAQKGIEAGIEAAIRGLEKIYVLSDFKLINWAAKINGTNFLKPNSLVEIVNEAYYKCIDVEAPTDSLFCGAMEGLGKRSYTLPLETISQMAADAAGKANKAAKTAEAAQIASVNAESAHLYSAIGYSVTAILIIVLVMFNQFIIYIFLNQQPT
ncbi:rifin [Plasmodium falciparum IGH-CR14]|uniref:Rifin n=1 Tax=Plasmodium falciparum IGH-CR14 TaxID=580059 RepID=A0A0L1I527_PLAFA|nr:rifin [Plasmodium falciparum IGH-CR14]